MTDYRFNVTPDHDTECPTEWGTGVEVYAHRVPAYYSGRMPLASDADDECIRLVAEYMYRGYSVERSIELVNRRARILGVSGLLMVPRNFSGYSQGDWIDCIVVGPDEDTIKLVGDAFERWFAGDVWVVGVEHAVTYRSDEGNEIVRWETADEYDFIGGWYADTPEEAAEQYASDYADDLPDGTPVHVTY